MKKNNKRNKSKEELKEYLKELSTKESLNDEDAERLSNMIDNFVFGSKTERIISIMAAFVIKLIIFYFVSIVASAFFLNQFLLDRYYIFLIDGCIAFLLTTMETIVTTSKTVSVKKFILSLLFTTIFLLIFNSMMPIFSFGSIWIAYLLVIEVIYNMLMFTLLKRKFKM